MPTTKHTDDELDPMLTYLLMVGELDRPGATRPHRLHGWVAWLTRRPEEQAAALRAAWADHAERLTAEAAAHDFEPYAATKKRPSGPGFLAWCEAFLAAHRY